MTQQYRAHCHNADVPQGFITSGSNSGLSNPLRADDLNGEKGYHPSQKERSVSGISGWVGSFVRTWTRNSC